MLTKQALDTEFEFLTVDDTVGKAKELMGELQVHCIPVVEPDTNRLVGQVMMNTLYESEEDSLPLSELQLDEAVRIYKHQHIFEAARLMLQYEQRLLPVVDEELVVHGIIEKQQVLESLTSMLNLASHGSVLSLELNRRDFTLSEIVQLIETEGAKILGITVETSNSEKGAIRVSIKLNLKDVTRVVAALRRFGYEVSTETKNEVYGIDFETRVDELVKYLDM
ncbi:MAG: CBS domain-containing protein [Balneolaceae bacterium]|nr:CBS domain-containing protein [Balneolaceae bacterium]